jgi:phosphoglycolate phosphatase
MKLPRAIIFDLDGTLVDSLPDIVGAFCDAFLELGLTPPAGEEVRSQIGLPLEMMFTAFAPSAQVEGLSAAYRRLYPQRFTRLTRPYPGVREALATLRARGYRLGVATTKRTEMAQRLLVALGLHEALDHVQGTDGFPHKPAPDVVLRALSVLGAEGEWMVGDTVHDVEAGRAAGLATYALTWGTHDAARLTSAGATRVEGSLAPLLAVAEG